MREYTGRPRALGPSEYCNPLLGEDGSFASEFGEVTTDPEVISELDSAAELIQRAYEGQLPVSEGPVLAAEILLALPLMDDYYALHEQTGTHAVRRTADRLKLYLTSSCRTYVQQGGSPTLLLCEYYFGESDVRAKAAGSQKDEAAKADLLAGLQAVQAFSQLHRPGMKNEAPDVIREQVVPHITGSFRSLYNFIGCIKAISDSVPQISNHDTEAVLEYTNEVIFAYSEVLRKMSASELAEWIRISENDLKDFTPSKPGYQPTEKEIDRTNQGIFDVAMVAFVASLSSHVEGKPVYDHDKVCGVIDYCKDQAKQEIPENYKRSLYYSAAMLAAKSIMGAQLAEYERQGLDPYDELAKTYFRFGPGTDSGLRKINDFFIEYDGSDIGSVKPYQLETMASEVIGRSEFEAVLKHLGNVKRV